MADENMKNFDFVPPNQFALLAALLGLLFTRGFDANEQNAIGNFFVSIGQSTLTNAAQVENRKAHDLDKDDISKKIDALSNQLNDIKKQINKK